MERILVSMNRGKVPWEALSRSIALAKRIGASLYVLSVFPPGKPDAGPDPDSRRKLDQQIKDASDDGLHVDSFISEGSYEQEVIRFVEQNKITLLVTEYGNIGRGHSEQEWASLQTIRHRVSCRVEIVTPRRMTSRGE
ncbi:universal stress protein [Oceanidesulfovibrio marinus]|uniref:Universal stress protein n=1 Tax=Oceanidesulfovibrio marinus TaxID=370038 RepID=A0A6P1ZDL4_9BACT|nr:universal stress protein [Oceanidesulfovibrio marinus]QJT09716.1 universal stress protein [Oceanidesulfovibrio marinus]TVM31529.1 universal stress protein [Oceanidesulfovibrio marinus]